MRSRRQPDASRMHSSSGSAYHEQLRSDSVSTVWPGSFDISADVLPITMQDFIDSSEEC